MAVGCQIGKLSGPEARPGSLLVPGVGEGTRRGKRKKWRGFGESQAGRRWAKGVRADGNHGRPCLKGTQLQNFKDAENPGKPGCSCSCDWVSNRQVGRPRKSACIATWQLFCSAHRRCAEKFHWRKPYLGERPAASLRRLRAGERADPADGHRALRRCDTGGGRAARQLADGDGQHR
jgi:hypothetical protein